MTTGRATEARASGYAAGLEAAIQEVLIVQANYRRVSARAACEKCVKAVRALAKEAPPEVPENG